VRNLVLIYMPVQITMWIIAFTLINGYRIDRKTHADNLTRLAQAAALAEVSPLAAVVPGGGEDAGDLPLAARGDGASGVAL